MPRQSAIAGQIAPIIESFILSIDDLHAIIRHVSDILSAVDLAVLIAFGWLMVPFIRIIYSFINAATKSNKASDKKNEDSFEKSYLYFVSDHLSQISRLALLVYACDCVVVAFVSVGYKAEIVSNVFAKILYTSWLARRFSSLKRYLLGKVLDRAPNNCDKIQLLNRITDGMVYALLGVKILEYLSVETGLALGSIFAVGTTGGLIISLASQEIAKGIMSGVEMATSDRFYEGDNVHFGDGTQGYIVKMGFLRTKIRKYDSAVIDIPNSQLGGQRAINVSRSKTCRILTTLRFDFRDIQIIPKTLEAIKEEIRLACPKLIKDGTKPFRAMISSFEQDHVEAVINCYFDLPPTGEDFWANRELMFLAIDRGVRKTEIQYHRPICHIHE
eukprot:CAMPEP_0172305462 /NCGR_PEP_ID=MMETSP1058-20130122/6743_1 /TAXON_ID=83371 /ORGANISM="Detonula confervacea, Strain CCMP 353" /LENGTH=386 /DNA_ID=CAMNT_0013017063 /DNA_START=77 /DNA_END=1237 /DNA_ORIENTATION=-